LIQLSDITVINSDRCNGVDVVIILYMQRWLRWDDGWYIYYIYYESIIENEM